jgi:hypothetical protein
VHPIKQSTAITHPFFVHDASGDAVTGLTDGSFTKRISKGSGAFGAMTVTISEMENGWYSIPLSTSHSDTLGLLTIIFTNAGAKQVNLQFRVHARLPDDLAYPTTSGRSLDVTATGAAGIDWANVENPGTTVDLSATDINLVDTTTTNTDMRGTDSAALASVCTEGRLAELDAGNIPADVDTLLTRITSTLFTGITSLAEWLGLIAGKQAGDATARTEVRATGGGSGTYDETSDSLEAIRDTAPLGTAMRGTDSAALASVCTEGRLAELDAANIPADVDSILADTGTDGVLLAATATSAQLVDDNWDEVLSGATHNVALSAGKRLRDLQESGAVYAGFVWIDTNAANTGTESYVDGTSDNPVSTIAAANTIATNLSMSRFKVAPGSSITLAATQANQIFDGAEWTLALGGQSIAGSMFIGAVVSGTGTGADANFIDCELGTVTVAGCRMGGCRFSGTITFSAASDYYFHDCYSGVAGAGTPTIDFGAAVANTNLSMRRYSGGITINNKDGTGTDQMSLEGNGQLVVAASSGGAISVRGNFLVTNTGGATITYDDNTQNAVDILVDTGTTIPNTLGTPAGADMSADIAAVKVDTAAVLVDTADMQPKLGTPAGADMSADIAAVKVDTAAVLLDTAEIGAAGAGLTDLGGMSTGMKAEVNAEVVDTLNVDTYAEPGQGAPAATASIVTKLGHVYKVWRNKLTQTSTTYSVFADDGSTVDAKATVSDDGTTATKGEIVAGP